MTSNTEDSTVLNSLIATLLDSVDGYQKSAADISDPTLADKFNARARERQAAVAKLQAAVATAGGTPEDESSLLGSAHRAFMDLKEAVMGQDEKSILSEVDRGEDYLKAKFEAALNNADLSANARSAVLEAWTSVREGHDEMSALKHSLGA